MQIIREGERGGAGEWGKDQGLESGILEKQNVEPRM
jgi:hypothetical protein